MSNFVSMFDVVFGLRQNKEFQSEIGPLPEFTDGVKPVDITGVVCALEDADCQSYCFDEFGRFGIAKDETRERVKAILANDDYALSFKNLNEMGVDVDVLYDFGESPEWVSFGWLIDELPDFEACYENWKVKNGMEGKQTPSMKQPAGQSHIWDLMKGLLKHAIGEDAYKDIEKPKPEFVKAAKALRKHGFGGGASQDKNLRTNLKTIVDHGQL